MKKVYEASTALEAHMVKNLLESEGVDSRIDGEYLQGGVGDLQAIGAIRVVVEETDYSSAKEIIAAWEAIQPEPEQESIQIVKKSGVGNGFLLGVAVTLSIIYWVFGSPMAEKGADRNLDGNKDVIYYYDKKGSLISTEMDENFDGNFETLIKYKAGNVVSAEADTNNNGIIDHRRLYLNGVIKTVEFIDEISGKVRKRQYYRLNKLIADDFDTNGDGTLDSHYEYDQYEEKK